jgi:hypothetical protein
MAYGAASRRRVCIHRQGELKRGTVGYACRGPQPATVGFNDRTADRESHDHAAGFNGEEGVEQPVPFRSGNVRRNISSCARSLRGWSMPNQVSTSSWRAVHTTMRTLNILCILFGASWVFGPKFLFNLKRSNTSTHPCQIRKPKLTAWKMP